MGFLDNLLGNEQKNSDKDSRPKRGNPFNFGGPRTFQGQGQSLGGSKPGQIIPIVLTQPGPLGIRVEKRPNSQGTAIINSVVPGTQAADAGLMRGDILCFAGSNGQEEIMYDMFLELAKSTQRPIELEVRRLTTKAPATKPSPTTNPGQSKSKSAEADHRRQAVIAAAEAREKAHKAKSKPIKQVTKSTLAREKQQEELRQQQQQQQLEASTVPQSEASRQAAMLAKSGEAQLAQQLGYNPYETARATAGQARTATTATQHGSISANSAGDHLPSVAPPSNPVQAVDDGKDEIDTSDWPFAVSDAFATVVSTNLPAASCRILGKLIHNATTKGQSSNDPSDEAAAKFRKVRLSNPKIQAALVETSGEGAVELLLAVGFSLTEQDGESYLLYPLLALQDESEAELPSWIPQVVQQLEQRAAAGAK